MKESQFLGTVLPSHPAFQPLIQQMREKYGLREVLADQDPITEIFLADKEIPLEDFREEIKALVGGLPDFFRQMSQRYYRQPRVSFQQNLPIQESFDLFLRN